MAEQKEEIDVKILEKLRLRHLLEEPNVDTIHANGLEAGKRLGLTRPKPAP